MVTAVPSIDAGSDQLEALIRSAPDLAPLPRLQLLAIRAAADGRWSQGVPAEVPTSTSDQDPLLTSTSLKLDRAQLDRLIRALAGELQADTGYVLRRHLESGSVNSIELIRAAVTCDEEHFARLARELDVDPQLFGVIAQLGALPVLLACGRQLASTVTEIPWNQGYCPVCGAWPTLAEMRGLDREHWLRCGRCASGWQYGAGSCVFCGEDDHEQLSYLAPEKERESRRAVTCDRCQGYMKSLATLGPLSAAEILARDLGSVTLDVAALGAGYGRPSLTGFRLDMCIELREPSRRWRGWRS